MTILSGLPTDAGRGWYAQDAARHRRDAPRYCPACARPLALADGGRGMATEYWLAGDRVFVCYCGDCGWTGDVVLAGRVVGHEPVGEADRPAPVGLGATGG